MREEPAERKAVLEVRGLRRSFDGGETWAVADVSFDVFSEEIVAILGPSGCGKTTTMRIIAGLEQASEGDILIGGQSILHLSAHRRNIGMVFQDLAVFPHMTIGENIAFGLRMKGVERSETSRRVDDIMRVVEMPPEVFRHRMPRTLSGGQRQRVAIARTLAVEPAIVLFDEPMAALDRRLRDRMAVEIRQIQKRLRVPMIYVTHDQESASALADRIAVMQHGKIVQLGSPLEIYRNPVSRFVADFFGDMNVFAGSISTEGEVELSGKRLPLPGASRSKGSKATLGVRPEDIVISRIDTGQSIWQARLVEYHFSAGRFSYRFRLEDDGGSTGSILTATNANGEFAAEPGTKVWLSAVPGSLRLLAE